MFVCAYSLIHWKVELLPNFSNYPIKFSQLGTSWGTSLNRLLETSKNLVEHLKTFNLLTFKEGETIKAFNLRFMNLYNRIPETIKPSSQASLVQYYNALPPPYRHHLEENNVNCLGSSLQVRIEFEEKKLQTNLPFEQPSSKTDRTAMLQMMQEMHSRMISFEHRLMTKPKMTPTPPFRIMARPETSHSSESYVHHWWNFCDETRDPTMCETFLVAKERVKGMKNIPTVMAIETEEIPDEVYATINRSKT